MAYFVSECQSVTSIKSGVKWRTLLRNKWRPFQRNPGDLCSGMGGVLCVGIVATFTAEYPITYEAELESPFLNIFDGIRLRVSSREKIADQVIIVTFVLLNREMSISEASILVTKMNRLLKKYDDDWTDVDVMRIESGVWRGRTYILNPGMIGITLEEFNGIYLNITGFKEFIAQISIA